MKKTKRFHVLTLFLSVAMVLVFSFAAYAATSETVTKDGISATLVTDKDSYEAGEFIDAAVTIANNTGKKITVRTEITVPSALNLAGESVFNTVLNNGESWTSESGMLDDTTGGPATGDYTSTYMWAVVAVLAIGGVTALLVSSKRKKSMIAMLLCVTMVGGLFAGAVPAQADSISGTMDLVCPIKLDGEDAEVTALVIYTIEDEAESENPNEGDLEGSEEQSESAYYVVWDDFTFTSISGVNMISSWDISLPTGAATKTSNGVSFLDDSLYAKGQALRAFNAVKEDFTMEFSMMATAGMEDTFLELKKEDTTVIRFEVKEDRLYLGEEDLCTLPTESLANFKLHISPENGTYTVSVDGTTVMDGDVAKEFAFLNTADAIDRFYMETGVEDKGQIVLGTLRVYVDYYVNEKFLDGANLVINDEWTVTGEASTIYKLGTQGPDKYNALLCDGDSISRDVAYEQDGAWVEFQQLMEENEGEFVMILADDAGNEFKVATKDGKFGYYQGTEFVDVYDCVENLWYHVMVKQTDEGTELYLNHKMKADNLPNVKFTKMTFSAIGGEAMLDDIVVKDWIPLPDDYVPEPVAVEKENGAQLVGMQSCNLWAEGEHFGYDWLTDWEERTPILGYYDEISTESADWELKFKVEHGIDFELYCWYRPTDGQGAPIKMARNSRALHEGYMNAEYSDMMKFAITWESGSGGKDLADFKENIVPYWIEQYFKDSRYMLVDNKPIVGMYNITKLKSYFGGDTEGVKEAMDYLRQACVEAGFDGAYIIMCNSSATSAQEIAEAGFDGQYAYTWGATSNVAANQKQGMISVQTKLEEAGKEASGVIPTVSQGFWDKAWNRDDGNYASVETFQEVLEWVKEEFVPELDPDSLGSKIVLLDNWNEYGEGHFIMPAELAGFGYLDAIKAVFGDHTACEAEVQHMEPTQAQLDRIQHMYIQDRHVVLVDKDDAASDVVPLQGCNWTFDVDGDTEGWSVGTNDGRWIKDLKDWAVQNGEFWGVTFTPNELAAKQENGEFGSLTGAATADPSVMSPELAINAAEAVAIKIRMKGIGGAETIGKPAIYFITEEDQKWTGGKMVSAFYEEGADGYAEITFDMTTNSLWTGTIKQIRFDPINRDGEFFIDSIQILKKADGGDADLYLDGERVYTSYPVEEVEGNYMLSVDELSLLLDVYVSNPLEGGSLYVSTNTAFFEFPFDGENKMFANGERVDSIGAAEINNMLYVPIVDIFENIGTVKDAGGQDHPAYTIVAAPETSTEKAKIHINKYVDNSVLKGYYFTSGIEGWTYGGNAQAPKADGQGAIEIVGTGAEAKLWSPDINQFDVDAQKADHIRMRVKTNASSLKMMVSGDGTKYKYTYTNIPLTEDMLDDDGFYTVLVDLEEAKAADLGSAAEIDRVCIYFYDAEAGGTQTFVMDSFELLDLVEDNTEDEEENDYEPLKRYDFEGSNENWAYGGGDTVSLTNADSSLVITAKGSQSKIWSPEAQANHMNISLEELTHIRMSVKTTAEVENPTFYMELRMYSEATQTTPIITTINDIAITAGEDGWAEVVIDLTDMDWGDYTELDRVCIYQYNGSGGNEVFSMDYIEFLPEGVIEAEDDESEDEEEVEDENNVLKAFYFEAGSEKWEAGGIATSYADGTVLMDFTGSTRTDAGWKSPSAESDWLNLSPAEVGSVIATIQVAEGVVPDEAKIRCFSDSHKTLVLEVTAKYELLEGNTYKVIFDTTELSANCEEGVLLNTIRINGMNVIGTATQGKYYLDSVEFIRKEETTQEVVAKGWYFDSNSEGWNPGGSPKSHGYDKDKTAYKFETNGTNWVGFKGPDVTAEGLTLSDFNTIRIQLTGGTPNAVFTFDTKFNDANHSTTVCLVDSRQVTLDEEGNATILIDCTNATLGTAGVLEAIRIDMKSDAVNTCYIDSIELVQLGV